MSESPRRNRKDPTTMKPGTYPAELVKMTVGGQYLNVSIRLNPEGSRPPTNKEFKRLLDEVWKDYSSVSGNMTAEQFYSAAHTLRERMSGRS